MLYNLTISTAWTENDEVTHGSTNHQFRRSWYVRFPLPFGIRSNAAGHPRTVSIELEVYDDEASQKAAEERSEMEA